MWDLFYPFVRFKTERCPTIPRRYNQFIKILLFKIIDTLNLDNAYIRQ